LKQALKIIDALPEDHSRPIAFPSKLKIKPNENNPIIIPIKKRLIFWNYLSKTDTVSKSYDKKTQIAVKEFQENHGLLPDGIIGGGTIKALNIFKSERKEQIIANLERWRWFPDDFGDHYTIVNIPDFQINAIKKGDTIINQKVIVGTQKRRSPVLTSKLNYVVFNPTWTVPPTIIKEDLIPSATKSRNYFRKMNIVIFDYKKHKINPYSWKPENAKKYSYVQDPGRNNSLGNMKIIFPNKFSVYLHDTNHKDGFTRNFRSLSSGCTRVEKPLELAKYVLNDSIKWNDSIIAGVLKDKKTKNVNITQDIKHYQLYWTAWSKKNRLIFRDDIYDYDFELYCKLRN
jgi:L,D-transpeptidase YcbB